MHKGRLCIADYASVRRKCVFALDELIINMAENIEELSNTTSIALYEEIFTLCSKEVQNRQKLKDIGVEK